MTAIRGRMGDPPTGSRAIAPNESEVLCGIVRRLLPWLRAFRREIDRWAPMLSENGGEEAAAAVGRLIAPLTAAGEVLAPIDAACRERGAGQPGWRPSQRRIEPSEPSSVLASLRETLLVTLVEVEFTLAIVCEALPARAVEALVALETELRETRARLDRLAGR